MNTLNNDLPQVEKIEALASQCVLCASCLSTCPTYQESLDENKSPRGRIALIRAVANQQISLDNKVTEHLNSCLHCFSCVKNCPSQVDYASLIHYSDQRLLISSKSKRSFLSYLSEVILINPTLRNLLRSILRLARRFKVISLLAYSNTLFKSRLISYFSTFSYLSDSRRPYAIDSPSQYKPITLLIGCANSLFNEKISEQAKWLLTALSYDVKLNTNEVCCGAISYRRGKQALAINDNFYSKDEHYVSLNSSCAAHLNKRKDLEHEDIVDFIVNHKLAEAKELPFKALSTNALFHSSCSVRNQLVNSASQRQLIKLIPEISLLEYQSLSCCGASGTFMQDNSALSDKVASPYIDFIMDKKIQILISSDISCALHLKQQLEQRGYLLEVLHPISLLYQQLKLS